VKGSEACAREAFVDALRECLGLGPLYRAERCSSPAHEYSLPFARSTLSVASDDFLRDPRWDRGLPTLGAELRNAARPRIPRRRIGDAP
jgi:hypothetical protein